MGLPSPFSRSSTYQPARVSEYRGAALPARFDADADELRRVAEHGGMFDRSDRGLVRVTGRDRKTWLHNLLTNAVKTLEPMCGCYAFAIDVRGRCQFDLNILDVGEALWLDMDVQSMSTGLAHFSRYLISEDVQLADATSEFARLGIAGPDAPAAAQSLGCETAGALAPLAAAWIDAPPGRALLVRHDFAGVPGFELVVQRGAAIPWWDFVQARSGLRPGGQETLDLLRIEAGIPWLGRDIDEKVIPPETGQAERGIHYNKGCYLGQEVIERMRSHGSLARRLVKMRVRDGAGLVPPVEMKRDGKDVGRLTSLARDARSGDWLALGYLRTTVQDLAGTVAGDPPRAVESR